MIIMAIQFDEEDIKNLSKFFKFYKDARNTESLDSIGNSLQQTDNVVINKLNHFVQTITPALAPLATVVAQINKATIDELTELANSLSRLARNPYSQRAMTYFVRVTNGVLGFASFVANLLGD